MPKVNGKKFSYTPKGKAKAAAYRKKVSGKKKRTIDVAVVREKMGINYKSVPGRRYLKGK